MNGCHVDANNNFAWPSSYRFGQTVFLFSFVLGTVHCRSEMYLDETVLYRQFDMTMAALLHDEYLATMTGAIGGGLLTAPWHRCLFIIQLNWKNSIAC